MSCYVVNESGRAVHVTLDRDDEDPTPNHYNLIISRDAPDRKRHLEKFQVQSNRRRQVHCLLEPYALLVELRLPHAYWLTDNDPDGADLIVVRDKQ